MLPCTILIRPAMQLAAFLVQDKKVSPQSYSSRPFLCNLAPVSLMRTHPVQWVTHCTLQQQTCLFWRDVVQG